MEFMSRNHAAVVALKELGYSLVEIRRALVVLNETTHYALADTIGVHANAIALNLGGHRYNKAMQFAIGQIWQVPHDLLFEDIKPKTGARKQESRNGQNQ